MSLQKYLAAGLGPRVLTGIILLAVVFTAWKAGGFPLFLLLLAVCCAGQWELYSLFLPNAELAAKLFGVLLGAGLVAQCRFLPEYSAGLALTASFALLAVHSLAGWLLRGSAFSFPAWAGLGLFMGVMAQLGDFFESALKRAVHIKDSGKILPGHGGVLDRIDSVLFASAAFTLSRPFLG